MSDMLYTFEVKLLDSIHAYAEDVTTFSLDFHILVHHELC